jgi:hypothetical protein
MSKKTKKDRILSNFTKIEDAPIAQFAYERGGLAPLDYLSALQDDRTTS